MFKDVQPLNKHQGYPTGPNPYLKSRMGSLGVQYTASKKPKRTRNQNVRGMSPLNLTHESQTGDSLVPNAHTAKNEGSNNNII